MKLLIFIILFSHKLPQSFQHLNTTLYNTTISKFQIIPKKHQNQHKIYYILNLL